MCGVELTFSWGGVEPAWVRKSSSVSCSKQRRGMADWSSLAFDM